MTFISLLRKLYWTDGDNISMANMDGSNHTTLFTYQKGPVGEHIYTPLLPKISDSQFSSTW